MKSQVEILIEAIADLYKQLSLSLSRESELREVNADLANRFNNLKSSSDSDKWNPTSAQMDKDLARSIGTDKDSNG